MEMEVEDTKIPVEPTGVRLPASSLAYTTFYPIQPLSTSSAMSTYVHREEQHSWARQPSHKRKHDTMVQEEAPEFVSEEKRGRNTVVIHPGSRWLRIGRASDILPISVPNVIARRKKKEAVQPPIPFYGIRRPKLNNVAGKPKGAGADGEVDPDADADADADGDGDADADADAEGDAGANDENAMDEALEGTGAPTGNEEIDEGTGRVAAFRSAFKDRLKTYGVRYQPGASDSGANFNRVQSPEKIADHNDSQRISWIMTAPPGKNAFFGHDVFLLSDTLRKEFEVSWPFRGTRFNCSNRAQIPALMNDISDIWTEALTSELGIKRSEFKDFSAVLVVPDLADRTYIKELVHILLVELGFKQISVHQEGVCAGYGAQLGNACVVDVGALKTSICCIEDGLIVPDTRLTLSLGGDDITEMFYVLLQQSRFPYREMDLTRLYDWNLMQDLKHQYCSFHIDISGARPYEIIVRRPGAGTERYKFKMYDEYMAAPSVLFETGVVWYAEKRKHWRPVWNADLQEDLTNAPVEEITASMKLSTDHIIKDVARETEEAMARLAAAAEADPNAEKPQNITEPLDIPLRKRTVTNFRTESPPLVLPEGVTFPGGLPIDVPFETSKLPLDVAVFNSARGATENAPASVVSKFLETILLVGGGSLVRGLAEMLQQRLHAISLSFYGAELNKINVVQTPKELDPRVIVWKGASILGRLETSSEFWVTPKDWDRLGMRAFRDRSLFL